MVAMHPHLPSQLLQHPPRPKKSAMAAHPVKVVVMAIAVVVVAAMKGVVDPAAKAVVVSAESVRKASVPRDNALKAESKADAAKAAVAVADAVAAVASAVSALNVAMANSASASMPKANQWQSMPWV